MKSVTSRKASGLTVVSSLLLAAALLTSGGCVARHSTEAFLLKKEQSTNVKADVFKPQKTKFSDYIYLSSNPVYVPADSVFSVKMTDVRPGWIHPGKDWAMPDVDKEKWARKFQEHMWGKELWVLAKIESLDHNDPMEMKSKTFFHAGTVKFNSESFASVPLGVEESVLFTHDADTDYRVTLSIYEVDNFELKKILLEAKENMPGLVGVATTMFDAVKGMAGSVVGDALVKMMKADMDSPLFFERLLLKAGAELEFSGRFLLLRDDKTKSPEKGIQTDTYILYDLFKSAQTVQSEEITLNDSDTVPLLMNQTVPVGADVGLDVVEGQTITLPAGSEVLLSDDKTTGKLDKDLVVPLDSNQKIQVKKGNQVAIKGGQSLKVKGNQQLFPELNTFQVKVMQKDLEIGSDALVTLPAGEIQIRSGQFATIKDNKGKKKNLEIGTKQKMKTDAKVKLRSGQSVSVEDGASVTMVLPGLPRIVNGVVVECGASPYCFKDRASYYKMREHVYSQLNNFSARGDNSQDSLVRFDVLLAKSPRLNDLEDVKKKIKQMEDDKAAGKAFDEEKYKQALAEKTLLESIQ